MIPTRGSDSTLEPAYFSEMPKKGTELTAQQLKTLEILSSSVENHNNIYRGANLIEKGYSIDDIADMSESGKFDDIYIGDTIFIDNLKIENIPQPYSSLTHTKTFNKYQDYLICVGLDWFEGNIVQGHHSVWWIKSGVDSAEQQLLSTNSGYAESFAHTTLFPYMEEAFRKYFNYRMMPMHWNLSKKVGENGKITEQVKETCYMKLPNEIDVFGGHRLSDKTDQEGNLLQLPYWRLRSYLGLIGNYYPWFLSSMAGQGKFTQVDQNGNKVYAETITQEGQKYGNVMCPLIVLGKKVED